MANIFDRYEDKYIISSEQYQKLLEGLSAYGYRDEYAEYPIGSVYFDSADFSLARECIRSPHTNRKLRLRQYSHLPFREDSSIMFELKERRNGKVHKIRSNMDYATFKQGCLEGGLPESYNISRQLQDFQKQGALYPQILIQYSREAFRFDSDPELRVTFDADIACRKVDWPDINESRESLRFIFPRNCRLLEVKYSEAIPAWLGNMLHTNGIVRTDFSKYLLAYRSLFTETSG